MSSKPDHSEWSTAAILNYLVHIKENNGQKFPFTFANNFTVLMYGWSPNKLYHSMLGSKIKTFSSIGKEKELDSVQNDLCKDYVYIA